jgi:hypothetical protein
MSSLKSYFRDTWKPEYDKFKYSGWALLDKIPHDCDVLDVGCGYNLFKPHFENLYGIDPANDCADEVVSIEDFKSVGNQWSVVLCLGSINFGNDVEPQVEKVVGLTKKGGTIYWRQNPGVGDHPWKGVEEIQFFPWTIELNYQWAAKYGCKVQECKWDTGNRIYAEWIKV